MQKKYPITKARYCVLVLSILMFSCKNESKPTTINPKGNFNGLYTVEYPDSDMQYIWIFTEDMQYVLYPGVNSNYMDSRKSINYESPTHYYVDGKKFYSCGLGNGWKALPIADCKQRNSDPRYRIVSIDTLENKILTEKNQIIQLEDYYSKKHIKLKRSL